MKYLVTAKMELYQWVEADSEDEVQSYLKSGNGNWHQTMNLPLEDIKIVIGEVETTGEEVKEE